MYLWDKERKCWVKVFDISYDKRGYPHFLVYQNRQWIRRSAKYFSPDASYDKIYKGGLGYGTD